MVLLARANLLPPERYVYFNIDCPDATGAHLSCLPPFLSGWRRGLAEVVSLGRMDEQKWNAV